MPSSHTPRGEDPSADHKYIAILEATEAGKQTTTTTTTTTTYTTTSETTSLRNRKTPASSAFDMYGATLSNAFPDVKLQDTAKDVRELRETYNAGLTRDMKMRRKLLLQLKKLMVEGDGVLKEAMWKDLHKHPTESFVCETSLIMSEIQEHLDHMEDWAKPKFVGTNVANLPGFSYIHSEPLGVVCIIGTWNYPVNLLMAPLISALAAGNCCVVRLPGDDTTRYLNNVLISLFDKYMDKRFVRYVYGGVEETKAMLRERYDLIFATGGCFLGKIVARAAAEHLTPTVLELGGKSPCIVDSTADIALAARRVTWGAFTNAGQTCVRPDYLLVDESIGDKLIAAMEKQVAAFYGKDPQQSDSYGRIVNERMFTRLSRTIEADKNRVTFGGFVDAKENYISPTLLNFKNDLKAFTTSASMAEELFGPLLPIFYYPKGQLQWAIDFVLKHEKPLALYLYSTNGANKKKVVYETTAGSMVINDCMVQLTNSSLPFGGVGNSGMGAYHGKSGFDAFCHRKSVLYKYSLLDLAQRYAPYTPASQKLMSIVLRPITRTQIRILKFIAFLAVLAAIGFGIRAAVKN